MEHKFIATRFNTRVFPILMFDILVKLVECETWSPV